MTSHNSTSPTIKVHLSTDMLTQLLVDLILTKNTYSFCTIQGTILMDLTYADNLTSAKDLHKWLTQRLKGNPPLETTKE